MSAAVSPCGHRGDDFVVTGLYRTDDAAYIEGSFSMIYKFNDKGIAIAQEAKYVDINIPMPKGITGGSDEDEEIYEEESFASDEEDKGDEESGGDEETEVEEGEPKPRIAQHKVIPRGMVTLERRKYFVITELMSPSGDCYDLFISSVLNNGELEYIRPIPKAQAPDDLDMVSYVAAYATVNDELFLVFNDMAANLDKIDNDEIETFRDGDRKSIIAIVRVEGKDGDYKRQSITSQTRLLVPSSGSTLDGEIILYGETDFGAKHHTGVIRVSGFK